MTAPYRPSNGVDGSIFMDRWCRRCEKDAAYRHTGDGALGCPLIVRAYLYDEVHAEYPKEWIADDGLGTNARCTAFSEPPPVHDRRGMRHDRP